MSGLMGCFCLHSTTNCSSVYPFFFSPTIISCFDPFPSVGHLKISCLVRAGTLQPLNNYQLGHLAASILPHQLVGIPFPIKLHVIESHLHDKRGIFAGVSPTRHML